MTKTWLIAGLAMLVAGAAQGACVSPPASHVLHPAGSVDLVQGLDLAAPAGRLPLLSFYARRIGDAERALWLLRCLDEACSPGTIVKLDSDNFYDGDTQVLIRADGRPLVVNRRGGRPALFDCADAACSSGTNLVINTASNANDIVAALRADGRPVVGLIESAARRVVYLACDDVACAFPVRQTVMTYSSPSARMSMVLGSGDRPFFAISPSDNGSGELYAVACDSPACAAPTTRAIANEQSLRIDLALRADNRVVLHYRPSQGPSKLIVCNDFPCTAPTTQPLTGYSTSGMTLHPDGRPVLQVAAFVMGFYECATDTCSAQGAFQEIGRTANMGTMVSAITANGRPLVAWTDIAQGQAFLTPCDTSAIRRNGFEPVFDATPATLGAD